MDYQPHQLTKTALLCTAFIFSGGITSANAVLLQADVQTRESSIITDTDSNAGNETTDTSVTAYINSNSSSSAFSWGTDTGSMYVSSRAPGVDSGSYAEAIFKSIDTVTNLSGTTQVYDYNFHIYAGTLDLYQEDSSSQYSVDILLNGTSVFSSAALWSTDSSGNYGLYLSGTELTGNYSRGGTRYEWDAYDGYLQNLFTLNDGESIELTYIAKAISETGSDILTTASDNYCSSTVPGDIQQEEGDFNLLADLEAEGLPSNCFFKTSASFGDPNMLSGSPLNYPIPHPGGTPVPEPATLLLMFGGISGLVLIRRRKISAV